MLGVRLRRAAFAPNNAAADDPPLRRAWLAAVTLGPVDRCLIVLPATATLDHPWVEDRAAMLETVVVCRLLAPAVTARPLSRCPSTRARHGLEGASAARLALARSTGAVGRSPVRRLGLRHPRRCLDSADLYGATMAVSRPSTARAMAG